MSVRSGVLLLIGAVTAALFMLATDWSTKLLGLAVICGSFTYFAVQMDQVYRQLGDVQRLQAAYDQLDQQAKLIIRTDFELHHTQEALDRRLASLMSLYQLGRQLQVSLRPEEVFSRLEASVVENFGFSSGLLGMCASLDTLEWRSLIGVSEALATQVKHHLLQSGLLKQILTVPSPRTLEASTTDAPSRRLLELLRIPSAVVVGVLPQAGPAGCLLLGRTAAGTVDARGDEELAAILAKQLASAVENSALYEEAWAAQQDLERKVRERTHELAEANAQLQRLNKAKSDFVSAVSHELRTPMAAIKGYASLLLNGQFGALQKAQSERLAKIEKHTDALTQLINNLLDIARIESGRVTMEHRPIPVEDFFATIQDLVRPQLEQKHIRYVTELDGIKELAGDASHLQRVFINLLSNAIKYTPKEGEIRLGLRREKDTILASVKDTGCGIPAEDVPKLFQEFYRSSDPINQEVKGTGLGLALVKRIVEAHHGRIWVESEQHKGSTFYVTLPAA